MDGWLKEEWVLRGRWAAMGSKLWRADVIIWRGGVSEPTKTWTLSCLFSWKGRIWEMSHLKWRYQRSCGLWLWLRCLAVLFRTMLWIWHKTASSGEVSVLGRVESLLCCLALMTGLRIHLLHPLKMGKITPSKKKDVLGMTQNYIRWWGSIFGSLKCVKLAHYYHYFQVYSDSKY